MEKDSRRKFLGQIGWGGLVLVGCGGNDDSSSAAGGTDAGTGTGADASTDAGTGTDAGVGATGDAALDTPLPLATNPAWIQNQPLDTWFSIPGTELAGSPGAPADDPTNVYSSSNGRLSYSGMGLRGNEIVLAADGGHGDYSGNEVTSIDLSADAPVWQLRSAASPSPTENVAYYSDGRPSSRHTYWSTIWSPDKNRMMLHYSRFVYGSGISFKASNGFNLDTNTWDPAGTWSDGYSAGCADSDGNVYAMGVNYFELWKWTGATDTWAMVTQYPDAINVNPVCFDPKRSFLFALAWGDGQGDGTGLSAFTIAGTVKTAITFTPSAALTQFEADMPAYSAMEYDPKNDKYFFYEGAAAAPDRVYVITPNDTAVWDMAILTLGPGSIAPPAAKGAGIYNRFKYVAALNGFVVLSAGTSELSFLRTA